MKELSSGEGKKDAWTQAPDPARSTEPGGPEQSSRFAPSRTGGAETREVRLERLSRLSYLLDNSIRIPLIGYRIGYDAIIGLVPGFGDAVGLALSAYIVLSASRLGLPRSTLIRMAGNVGLEALIGAIPVLGDVFDATFKANARNIRLVQEQAGLPLRSAAGENKRHFRLLVVIAVALVVVAIVLIIATVGGLIQLLSA